MPAVAKKNGPFRIEDTVIDIDTEDILTFGQAAEWLPRRRQGKKTAVSTLWRWCEVGIAGVRLEAIFIGGVRCTSKQALQRFGEAISAARAGGSPGSTPTAPEAAPPDRTESRRRQDSAKAAKELDDLFSRPSKPTRRRRPATASK